MHIIVSIELTFVKKLPEVLAASGIKPPGLTDRRMGGTGEPVLVEYAHQVKSSVGAPGRTKGIEAESTSGAPVRSNTPLQTSPGADVPVVAMIAGKAGSSKGVHKMTKLVKH